MKRPILSCFLLLICTCTALARENYIYSRISTKEGLTSTINSIFKEDGGYIWIGSQNGLFRFNGTSLHHYDGPEFKEKPVLHIGDDNEGNIWVLTNDWLLRKAESEDKFIPVKEGEDKQPFYTMVSDSTGIWFGSKGKVYRYNYGSKQMHVFCEISHNPEFVVRNILITEDGGLLCCSHSGILYIDRNSASVSQHPLDSRRSASAALKDSRGRIWIAYYNNGIEVYSPEGKLIKAYNAGNSDLTNNIVLCLTERESKIWAGTDGGGINIIDHDNNHIRNLTHVAGDPSSLPAHSIKSIYTDSYGNIWAGSIRDGLIGISNSKMKTHSDVHIGLNTGLSNPTVLNLYQDPDTEDIWIGTDGEGLNRFNPKSHTFTHYEKTLKTKIVSIASYSDSELVLSAYGDRFWIFSKTNGSLREMKVEDEVINYQIRYAGRGLNVINENDGTLLITGNKVRRYDKATHRCTVIKASDGTVSTDNILLIGHSEEGIWFHDQSKVYFLKTGSEELSVMGKSDNGCLMFCGHLAPDGNIWLATSIGLQKFDKDSYGFVHIKSSLFDKASSVVCDGKSRIWVGTENQLYAYLPESDTFAIFGRSDGADPNEYLSKPHLMARNGDIYMGGVQGLLCIDATYAVDTAEEPVISLSDFVVDNIKLLPDGRGRYVLPRHSKDMTMEVSVNEKDIFREKRYRFIFSNDGGIYEITRPTLNLLTLPRPGRYTVKVSCTKRDGNWTEPMELVWMKIPQPWFLSWWFICTILVLGIVIAVIGFIAAARKRESKLAYMQKEQEQKAYEEKVQMLINISHELRTPLTLIMAPLRRLLKESEINQENLPVLNRMYRQSRRMKDLLNMVLDLRKMEVGKSRLKIETMDTAQWIQSVAGDIIDEERSEGIDVKVEVTEDAAELRMDRQKCETVLTNILMNAIKHSQSGDTISIKAERKDEMIRISISDQGPGLGDADMSQMFTRFYQSNSEKYGSGIGLSYSKILVEMHGGKIGTFNNEDKGATFWWEIPVSPSSVPEETVSGRAYLNELMGYNPGLEISVPECDTFSTANMTLMLVDDNKDLLEFLREALSGEFTEIITALSGNQALKAIASGKLPDIIVSDVNMPDGDGYQLCNTLKNNEKYNHIPVVLLTARGEEQSQSDSYKLGSDGFLAKPFEMETLIELLRGLLRKRSEVKKRYLNNEDSTADFGSEEEAFIIRFNKIVSEHLGDPELDQQLICRELGVSRALLYNKMKAIIGTGAKEYITRIRIEKAKSLMENPSLSIADIADMTGFTSQSYFSTAFKSQTGMTPSQYRQKDKA